MKNLSIERLATKPDTENNIFGKDPLKKNTNSSRTQVRKREHAGNMIRRANDRTNRSRYKLIWITFFDFFKPLISGATPSKVSILPRKEPPEKFQKIGT